MTSSLKNITIDSTGKLQLPIGATANRPGDPGVGMFRFNTDLNYTEIYDGTSWVPFSNPVIQKNVGFGGIISAYGPYRTHTFIRKEIYTSIEETAVTDDSADATWKVMKTFTVAESGVVNFRFRGYIQSGTYYWGWRIRANSSTVLASGGFATNPAPGEPGINVHVYGLHEVNNINVSAGDVITLEMVSTTGDNTTATNGNGQILYCKDLIVTQTGYTFIPQQTGTIEVLVVGAGGAGGQSQSDRNAGGGGAGGLIYNSAFPVTAGQSYSVTVGRGGTKNTSGTDSVFGSLTATGGGRGGYSGAENGANGGSGGGGSNSGLGGTGIQGQGTAGGAGYPSGVPYGGGGGGGFWSAGEPGIATTRGGNGGAGQLFSISGQSTWYAGGGGGGCSNYTAGVGGSGVGGNGSNTGDFATAGYINTGSGGGGASSINGSPFWGGAGADGIIIVRYVSQNTTAVSQSFTTVGTATWTCPTGVTQIAVLVVAGGGSGATAEGGGGGAGGLIYNSAFPVTAGTSYTVIVGAGGAASSGVGNNGANSVFGSLTAIGGGGGGQVNTNNAKSGGSGGGGGRTSTVVCAGGAGTSNQGYAGGTSPVISGFPASGGGGAGGRGENGTFCYAPYGGFGGNGGPGLPIGISGTVTYYAGGGGGGSGTNNNNPVFGFGGKGGGGDGGRYNSAGSAGVSNTGGGGGGGGQGSTGSAGGAGGSGIVIVQWQT